MAIKINNNFLSFLIILLLLVLFSNCNNEPSERDNTNGIATELEFDKNSDGNFYFKLTVHNQNSYDVGVIYIGEIRFKSNSDELSKLVADTIIKILLPDTTISSNEIEPEMVTTLYGIPELTTIKSNRTQEFNITYHSNLYKDFDIWDKETSLQIIINSSYLAANIDKSLGLSEKEFDQKYPDITLIKEDIVSPIVELN